MPAMKSPLRFAPLYMERVWGGRELEKVYGRTLPEADRPYGESWELVDRADEQSRVVGGPWNGKTLHELWAGHREEIFGASLPASERFPILIKILDARDDLSIQVHPPAGRAAALGGEPKTEMWYIADRSPGAKLYAGLRKGVSRADFEQAIAQGTVADCVHAIEPGPGESIFIPSGRLHAIGAGFLIHEIQQNSDTTYRVFDWNRCGLDGKPRELHVEPSLASIDFNDFEPGMDPAEGTVLASCPYFHTERQSLQTGQALHPQRPERFEILSVVSGLLEDQEGGLHGPGCLLLLPAGAAPLTARDTTTVLVIQLPDT